jgi:hypothetical protein
MRNVWLALWDEMTGATAQVDDGQWRDGVCSDFIGGSSTTTVGHMAIGHHGDGDRPSK